MRSPSGDSKIWPEGAATFLCSVEGWVVDSSAFLVGEPFRGECLRLSCGFRAGMSLSGPTMTLYPRV